MFKGLILLMQLFNVFICNLASNLRCFQVTTHKLNLQIFTSNQVFDALLSRLLFKVVILLSLDHMDSVSIDKVVENDKVFSQRLYIRRKVLATSWAHKNIAFLEVN